MKPFGSGSGREKNLRVKLAGADGGKLRVRGCSFGNDEPSIASRPGGEGAIFTEKKGVLRPGRGG